jgi:hypothetical protein
MIAFSIAKEDFSNIFMAISIQLFNFYKLDLFQIINFLEKENFLLNIIKILTKKICLNIDFCSLKVNFS